MLFLSIADMAMRIFSDCRKHSMSCGNRATWTVFTGSGSAENTIPIGFIPIKGPRHETF